MNVPRTLTIVKPDGVSQKVVGQIISRFEAEGFRVVAMKMVRLSRQQAEGFYHVHRERPFFSSLTRFMSSGPCVPMVLEAPRRHQAPPRRHGGDRPRKGRRRHDPPRVRLVGGAQRRPGSDSPESAAFEISYFFGALEICGVKATPDRMSPPEASRGDVPRALSFPRSRRARRFATAIARCCARAAGAAATYLSAQQLGQGEPQVPGVSLFQLQPTSRTGGGCGRRRVCRIAGPAEDHGGGFSTTSAARSTRARPCRHRA
jgi:nucleoside-diphosphate kinase